MNKVIIICFSICWMLQACVESEYSISCRQLPAEGRVIVMIDSASYWINYWTEPDSEHFVYRPGSLAGNSPVNVENTLRTLKLSYNNDEIPVSLVVYTNHFVKEGILKIAATDIIACSTYFQRGNYLWHRLWLQKAGQFVEVPEMHCRTTGISYNDRYEISSHYLSKTVRSVFAFDITELTYSRLQASGKSKDLKNVLASNSSK